jgi:hypothetical protein
VDSFGRQGQCRVEHHRSHLRVVYSGWWRYCQVANLIGMVDQIIGMEIVDHQEKHEVAPPEVGGAWLAVGR